MSKDVFAVLGIGINGGAPSDNCNALAPVILAFSNLVRFGGPTVIFLFSTGISTGS